MKRIFTVLLSFLFILGSVINFTSCVEQVSSETGFYKEDFLEDYQLSGLLKPNYVYQDHMDSRIFGSIELQEFERYAAEVLQFITSKYEYVGTSNVRMIRSGSYWYIPCEKKLENYRSENFSEIVYQFVFFQDAPQERDYTYKEVTLIYEKIYSQTWPDGDPYNFYMFLNEYSGVYFYHGENIVEEVEVEFVTLPSVEGKTYNADYRHGYRGVLESKEELSAFYEQRKEEYLLEQTDLETLFEKYDEEYFENKYLAVLAVEWKKGEPFSIPFYYVEDFLTKQLLMVKVKYLEIEEDEKEIVSIMLEVDKELCPRVVGVDYYTG